MSESELERAFVPFERADNRYQLSNENGGGTGLGLALVQRLVELHDGDVTITSTPNEGTTVVVTLPIAGPRRDAEKADDTPALAGADVEQPADTEEPTARRKTARGGRRAAA
jgi:cell cycle sensor histidine kinase DivJ